MARYTIEGGQAGHARLNVLAEVMRPATTSLLAAVSVPAGGRCLDVGCGGGHVSRELARLVGPTGSVVGIDFDPEILKLARSDAREHGVATIDFRVGDANALPEGPYDVAYARFLLSHVDDPGAVVRSMARALAPSGVAIVEDIDFTGSFCYPESAAYQRHVELYRETVRRRGGNADIGPILPALLRAAGLQAIQVRVVQPAALQGEGKLVAYLTLERIAQAITDEGVATSEEVQKVLEELLTFTNDTTTLVSLPRIVQAWGYAL
jgi:ubiquinone/menaquinone biosynthesis C-methylase UbiE